MLWIYYYVVIICENIDINLYFWKINCLLFELKVVYECDELLGRISIFFIYVICILKVWLVCMLILNGCFFKVIFLKW